jgi:superfamily II DNA or RNA helicase
MTFAVGSLVRARGREWVVLPESEGPLLILRPLGGTEDEVAGIWTPLEEVEPAEFELPDPTQVGDHRAGRLLREAVRLGFRDSAGPFRSFGHIAVEPRPYQLVPLLMALKLDPVRLLIADDVGIGKTVEACLVARELLDRGEVQRLAVLCPPHLAEQWQRELAAKFHIEAELVLPSTAPRLERRCQLGESLFEVYPHVIVSLDFIKMERRREDFVRSCPELVIVDEAHTCASGTEQAGQRHQRQRLIERLGRDERVRRHLILVTATPDSGQEDALGTLLGLLSPQLAQLPPDLGGKENEGLRRRIAAHLVQRRRGDIRNYLDTETPFPERQPAERTYKLSKDYREFFDKVLGFARKRVREAGGTAYRQRVNWWAAVGLLRALGSSPAAAEATLQKRAGDEVDGSSAELDDAEERELLDLGIDETGTGSDVEPAGDTTAHDAERAQLRALARKAAALRGRADMKLAGAVQMVKDLVRDGRHPILFCKFIPTAEYLAVALRDALPRDVTVECVTGKLPPEDREARVEALGEHAKRVLICTDCLSEGINLQESFDAVVHYDLAWTPTRHEQREGRVDRYGQPKSTVATVTYFGADNPVDGFLLEILLKKNERIRRRLGVSVPVPSGTRDVMKAMLEWLLLRDEQGQQILPGLEAALQPQTTALHEQWDREADRREKRSRTIFAQESIKVEEVGRELAAARAAIGSAADVRGFVEDVVIGSGGHVSEQGGVIELDLREAPRALRDNLGGRNVVRARFELPVPDGVVHLARTHPWIEALAAYTLEAALDGVDNSVARRCGVIRTRRVAKRTTLLLIRFRHDLIVSRRDAPERRLLTEECGLLAFRGAPDEAEWLEPDDAEALFIVRPDANVLPEQARTLVQRVQEGYGFLQPHLEAEARRRAEHLLSTHRRVREESRARGLAYRVEPLLPPDVLGIYVYLPVTS